MNARRDPLEVELSSLRPRPISADLRRRIAMQLADPEPTRSRGPWKLAVVGSLTAACLALVAWRWMGKPVVESPPEVVRLSPAIDGAADIPRPTLLAYQRALARSPEKLEDLFNRQALATAVVDPDFVRVGAFMHSAAARHALLGDD